MIFFKNFGLFAITLGKYKRIFKIPFSIALSFPCACLYKELSKKSKREVFLADIKIWYLFVVSRNKNLGINRTVI